MPLINLYTGWQAEKKEKKKRKSEADDGEPAKKKKKKEKKYERLSYHVYSRLWLALSCFAADTLTLSFANCQGEEIQEGEGGCRASRSRGTSRSRGASGRPGSAVACCRIPRC